MNQTLNNHLLLKNLHTALCAICVLLSIIGLVLLFSGHLVKPLSDTMRQFLAANNVSSMMSFKYLSVFILLAFSGLFAYGRALKLTLLGFLGIGMFLVAEWLI